MNIYPTTHIFLQLKVTSNRYLSSHCCYGVLLLSNQFYIDISLTILCDISESV